jgi:glutamate N-acetyltransferase/amino-acid N-acetyltransferase
MAVNLTGLPILHPVPGVQVGTACAGIKQTARDDLTVFAMDEGGTAAAVFTRNAFCAAPVLVAREHLAGRAPRYLLINSGNANAGTGQQGMSDARASCEALGTAARCAAQAVLPFSTGVIGMPLPVDKIRAALPTALAALGENHWENAARAIMTTDTVPKGASCQIEIAGKRVTLTGIAKGSGMIRPDMATMLAFVATDAELAGPLLQDCLNRAVNLSFNRITVDGDTSTNDACVLMATGQSGARPEGDDLARFQEALNAVCRRLAQAIVRDGEGATKFITIAVESGENAQECLEVAYTIAHSPLIKTAFFASDANWGRILAAVGRAGLRDLNLEAVKIYLGEVCIVENGGRAAGYTEQAGQAVMRQAEITVRVELHRGQAREEVWTCDFSYDYVKINAEYRT